MEEEVRLALLMQAEEDDLVQWEDRSGSEAELSEVDRAVEVEWSGFDEDINFVSTQDIEREAS